MLVEPMVACWATKPVNSFIVHVQNLALSTDVFIEGSQDVSTRIRVHLSMERRRVIAEAEELYGACTGISLQLVNL